MTKTKIISEVTPKELYCGISSCPAIFETNKDSYILIGKNGKAKKLGISKRVGKDEFVVEVPKKLIDKKIN